jgi:hypothetical protein
VCFQHISTRWVAFNGGDLAAGLIGLAGDALSGAVLSYFGGKLMKGVVDNMLFGALANSALGFLVSLIPGWATVGGSSAAALFGFARFMMTPVGKPGGYGFFAGALSAPINMASNWAASAVGNAWGSKPSDLPAAQAPPATAPSSPPASGQQPPSGPACFHSFYFATATCGSGWRCLYPGRPVGWSFYSEKPTPSGINGGDPP